MCPLFPPPSFEYTDAELLISSSLSTCRVVKFGFSPFWPILVNCWQGNDASILEMEDPDGVIVDDLFESYRCLDFHENR